ncbi:CNNM domain-containing protein [Blastopirellula sp. JC732]|uniref:CNNM domain-containing protein n=1 Tax=Blastopirellula sediminis TaxID=2894196 RepID=A0A9X1MQA2_9BACT|nr:CNNM domain-containing protein [Blastopirellula sediminis]MCC9605897.1 CNNM domain-containing protein [Blastopirellula sediminis]MCC9630804.1 CNNM domain-containing protein [Blastopirellula sediminis]
MELITAITPWLIFMAALLALSGIFSAAEAAFFYLKIEDRRKLASGTSTQQIAAQLLNDPDRLLSAVLFWNLVVNVLYFSLASVVGIRIEKDFGGAAAAGFAAGSLMVIIFTSEMLPKSLAVLRAPEIATFLALPVVVACKLADPILPLLRTVITLSRRLIWPGFKPEPYLQVSDLERAIQFSTENAALLEQEQVALQNIVSLSDLTVNELMRPRRQYRSFRPPVAKADLAGEVPPSGYLLVTEPDSEDVAGAFNLMTATELPEENLERLAVPVLYAPWCTKASVVLQQMITRQREVAAIVNELGEVIGVLTLSDAAEAIFSYHSGRSERLLQRQTFEQVEPGVWLIPGMTSLRRLAKRFGVEVPPVRPTTVNGLLHEELEQLPEPGDEVTWGPFHFHVVSVPQRGQPIVRLSLVEKEEEST